MSLAALTSHVGGQKSARTPESQQHSDTRSRVVDLMEPLEQTSTVHMIPTIQELALCNGGIEGKTAGYSDYTVGKLALPCADSVADLRAAGRSADDAREVAIGEVSKFGLRRTESSGLSRGRFVHEEAAVYVVCNGIHQERRDAVPDPGPLLLKSALQSESLRE